MRMVGQCDCVGAGSVSVPGHPSNFRYGRARVRCACSTWWMSGLFFCFFSFSSFLIIFSPHLSYLSPVFPIFNPRLSYLSPTSFLSLPHVFPIFPPHLSYLYPISFLSFSHIFPIFMLPTLNQRTIGPVSLTDCWGYVKISGYWGKEV